MDSDAEDQGAKWVQHASEQRQDRGGLRGVEGRCAYVLSIELVDQENRHLPEVDVIRVKGLELVPPVAEATALAQRFLGDLERQDPVGIQSYTDPLFGPEGFA